ncbi:hypothetical protein [Salmonella enterica]
MSVTMVSTSGRQVQMTRLNCPNR